MTIPRKPKIIKVKIENEPKAATSADAGYKVGYKSPPLHSRYTKGQSGNPRGRRPRKNVWGELFEELGRLVVVTQDGKRQKLPSQTIILRRAIAEAMKGNVHFFKLLLRHLPLLEKVELPKPVRPKTSEEKFKQVREHLAVIIRNARAGYAEELRQRYGSSEIAPPTGDEFKFR